MADLPRLVQRCPDCAGNGTHTNPEFVDWTEEQGLSEPEITEAVVEGHPDAPDAELTCGVCEGEGRIPTDAGQRILDLVRDFGGEEDA